MSQLSVATTLPAKCTRQRRFWQTHRVLHSLFVLTLAFFFAACAQRSRSAATANDQQPIANSSTSNLAAKRININTASAKKLQSLPGIGEALAQRIVEHREKYGAFRRPEHLIVVRGISDRRFRALRDLIAVE